MLDFEKKLFNKGIKYIAGIDEVGRGPLAGPMVIGSVILDLEKVLNTNYDVVWEKTYGRINDSKKLTEKARVELEKFILGNCISFSIVEIPHGELDLVGISQSTQNAFYRAINLLDTKPQHIFTDTFEIKKITKENQTNIVKGDSKSITIAAASIVAKVHRDNIMIKYAEQYPNYGFEKHKGYGTKYHVEMIDKHGPCEIHRTSFEPIKSLLKR